MDMQRQWHRGRLMVILGGSLVAILMLAGTPASASHSVEHVKMVLEEYFLAGGPADQGTKLAVDRPTFSQEGQDGDVPAVQVASSAGATVEDAGAFWVGEFEEPVTVAGELVLTLHTFALPAAAFATVIVYADGEEIGRTSGSAANIGNPGNPAENPRTVTVQLKPTAEIEQLLIRIVGDDPPSGREAKIFYGTGDYPSGFVLPTIVPCEENDSHPDCPQD